MVKHVQNAQLKKSEFVRQDQAKYEVEIIKNKKGKIKQLRVIYTIYPLYDRGYENYQQLNVNITRLLKYTSIEAYYVRENWNGTGYFPVCYTKMQLPDEFFNFIVGELETDTDIRTTVLALFKRLKNAIQTTGEDNECFYATYYFPL